MTSLAQFGTCLFTLFQKKMCMCLCVCVFRGKDEDRYTEKDSEAK